MKIKSILIILMSLSNILLFASTPSDKEAQASFSYCIKENQRPDIKNWIIFPFKFEYALHGEGTSGTTNVQFSSPVIPQTSVYPLTIEENLLRTTFSATFDETLFSFNATDEAGMTFSIISMHVPEEGFDLHKSMDSLVSGIEKSPESRIAAVIPPQSTDTSAYSIMWIRNDKLITMKVIQRTHFIYFLETNVSKEIYRDFESIKIGPSLDEWMKDSLKTGAFFNSFVSSDALNSQ